MNKKNKGLLNQQLTYNNYEELVLNYFAVDIIFRFTSHENESVCHVS